ncbi:MAG TPA: 4-alpha-glucanotransferase [Verrucomicrobiae bacterium]|jgi:4-alpha-glucanotransferase|nr:4-alpha-glucanotransferase [Verrucomicrobiae bacterium]
MPKITIDRNGISQCYKDGQGAWHEIPEKTLQAIRSALDRHAAGEKKAGLRVLRAGQKFELTSPVLLKLEDGATQVCAKALPQDLPIGYHEFTEERTGNQTHLIVSPHECYLPGSLRAWGWAIQVYALRSKNSWGMGDFGDLRDFARWASRELRCDFILSNPLGATTPILPQQPSPYYPGSRRFLNPLYLRIEEILGANQASLTKLAAAGQKLNEQRLIDRDCVFQLKMNALQKIWKRFDTHRDFEDFCQQQGQPLTEFASFCVLAEHFKTGWRAWPGPFTRADSPDVAAFVRRHPERIRFHQWLQWLLNKQLARAAKALPVMQDMPIGIDPNGADAWCWQDMLALDMSIGAPPDAFNTQGQNWGLPPFIPQRLRECGYIPFRETIQAQMRFGGGLRIDHVMGLFRLFWIPRNASPSEGTYVHYPADEFLAVLAIESHRAKGVVVGEDLGTVDPKIRTVLKRRRVLSYRLVWFESGPISKFPRQALASVTTHDLFTVAGLWNGSDLAAQKKLGLQPNENGVRKILKRLQGAIRLPATADVNEAIVKTYSLLSKAPSILKVAAMDDALAVQERPNMPGTQDTWPNWRIGLPSPLESIRKNKLIRKISIVMGKRTVEE